MQSTAEESTKGNSGNVSQSDVTKLPNKSVFSATAGNAENMNRRRPTQKGCSSKPQNTYQLIKHRRNALRDTNAVPHLDQLARGDGPCARALKNGRYLCLVQPPR